MFFKEKKADTDVETQIYVKKEDAGKGIRENRIQSFMKRRNRDTLL